MIAATGGLFALVLIAGLAILYLHRASDVEESVAAGPLPRLLGFFGVGDLPVLLAASVFCAAAGSGGIALLALAQSALGEACPGWFPALALASASGAGLGALGLTASARRRHRSNKPIQIQKRT